MTDSTITVELTQRDCYLLMLAFHDLRAEDGDPAWNDPAVSRLRHKIAAAIAEQHPA